jgi:hypothetical protein
MLSHRTCTLVQYMYISGGGGAVYMYYVHVHVHVCTVYRIIFYGIHNYSLSLQWRIQGGCSGCSSTPLRLRGMQGISAIMPKFTVIDIVTRILLDKNALPSFKIAS